MYCGKCEAYIPEFEGMKACLVCHASIEHALPYRGAAVRKKAEASEPAPKIVVPRPPMRFLTALLYAATLLQLTAFIPSNPFHSSRYEMAFATVFGLLVIHFFRKGRNWARVLLLVSCGFNVLFIPLYACFAKPDVLMDVSIVLDMLLSVYLLRFLNKKQVRDYFYSMSRPADAGSRPKVRKRWIVGGVAVLIVAVCGGALASIVWYFADKARRMDVWMQDIVSLESRRLTTRGANTHPVFSRDGSRIAYCHSEDPADKKTASWISTVSVADQIHTPVVEGGGPLSSPAWGAEDKSLFYLSKKGDAFDIFEHVFEDGSVRQLTDDGGIKRDLQASPDGEWLLFLYGPEDEDPQLYIMPAGGGERTRLSKIGGFLYTPQHPFWNPDSKHVTYLGLTTLITVDLEGNITSERELSDYQLVNISRIAPFPSVTDGSIILNARSIKSPGPFDFDLYLLRGSTGQLSLLRKSSVAESGHQLSPDGGKIVFSKPRD